jgi:hypothetical protein
VEKDTTRLNSYFKRTAPKFLMYFYKKVFKLLFFELFKKLKKDSSATSFIYLDYLKFKSLYWFFFEGLKNIVLKSSISPSSYFIHNLGRVAVMMDALPLEEKKSIFMFAYKKNLYREGGNSVANTFSVHNAKANASTLFSNYYKINNYVILKYFLYLFSDRGIFFNMSSNFHKNKFKNFFGFICACAKKKYKNILLSGQSKNKILESRGSGSALVKNLLSRSIKPTRLINLKSRKFMYKVFYSTLSIYKDTFLECLSIDELKYL